MTDQLTRLELLRRAALGGTVLTLPGILAACGGDGDEETGGSTSTAKQQLADTLRFSNWTLYIDRDEKTKRSPTLDQFKQKTGTAVKYVEELDSPEAT